MSCFSELLNRIPDGDNELVGEASARRVTIDFDGLLDLRDREQSKQAEWRCSIVDLMKLLELDTSYGSRKVLLLELGDKQIDIDLNGVAEMNLWLHRQVMKKLVENRGRYRRDC
ncbi:MAG: DUF3597 family protein [Verrucomicrobiota bacterium]|nr:DUF3597 family protein [Verrucomicrobiota bacterium]